MVIGHGVDIVDLKRFKIMNNDRLARIARRICAESEIQELENSKLPYKYLAKIWAAKEAISKAFGTGIRNNVTWKNILIENNELGKPVVYFKESISGPICHLSISHEKDYLIASAILEIV